MVGLVQNGDGKMKTLLDTEREALGLGIDDGVEVVALQKVPDAAFDLTGWQMIELSM